MAKTHAVVCPHHGCFWNSSLGEHTLQGKSASLRHLGSMHHGDCVSLHLPDAFGGGYNADPYLSSAMVALFAASSFSLLFLFL
jgi:hypothetical protein